MTDESILIGTCNRKKEKKKNTCYKFCEMSFYINLSNIYRSAEEKLQQGSIKKGWDYSTWSNILVYPHDVHSLEMNAGAFFSLLPPTSFVLKHPAPPQVRLGFFNSCLDFSQFQIKKDGKRKRSPISKWDLTILDHERNFLISDTDLQGTLWRFGNE